ncbi:MAG: hypothetical protein M1429_01100 [Patescibacteria group bacterium]|nr:hypothetical protein [Patescibacteria group bacterium]
MRDTKARRKRLAKRSRIGRYQEGVVKKILEDAIDPKGQPVFCQVILHQPNSLEDQQGKDLTVVKEVSGELVDCSFGITISQKSILRSRENHPHVSQLYFPPGTSAEMIIFEVESLFKQLSLS